MEILDIPASQVGKLIGKAGETIRNLQLSTDTRIQVRDGAPPPAAAVWVQARLRVGAALGCAAEVGRAQPHRPGAMELLQGQTAPTAACGGRHVSSAAPNASGTWLLPQCAELELPRPAGGPRERGRDQACDHHRHERVSAERLIKQQRTLLRDSGWIELGSTPHAIAPCQSGAAAGSCTLPLSCVAALHTRRPCTHLPLPRAAWPHAACTSRHSPAARRWHAASLRSSPSCRMRRQRRNWSAPPALWAASSAAAARPSARCSRRARWVLAGRDGLRHGMAGIAAELPAGLRAGLRLCSMGLQDCLRPQPTSGSATGCALQLAVGLAASPLILCLLGRPVMCCAGAHHCGPELPGGCAPQDHHPGKLGVSWVLGSGASCQPAGRWSSCAGPGLTACDAAQEGWPSV